MARPDADIFPVILPPTADLETDETRDGPVDLSTSNVPEHEVKYPFNKVQKFSSGHILEFNNTAGSEFIRLAHGPKGTEIIMTKDGDIWIRQPGDRDEIIGGNTTIDHTGSLYGVYHSDYTLDVAGDLTFKVGGELKWEISDQIRIDAFEEFNEDEQTDNEYLNSRAIDTGYTDQFFNEEPIGDAQFGLEDIVNMGSGGSSDGGGFGGGGSSSSSIEEGGHSRTVPDTINTAYTVEFDPSLAGKFVTEHVGYIKGFSAKTRNKPVQPSLIQMMDTATAKTPGVEYILIYSGGQSNDRRTGSHRHDRGFAADIEFYDEGGRMLSLATGSADIPTIQTWIQHGLSAGILSFGAGNGYMRNLRMHVDIAPGNTIPASSGRMWGSQAATSAGAPTWLRRAMGY